MAEVEDKMPEVLLYHAILDKSKNGNLFFSPLSINIALAMLKEGARGNTHAQLSKLLTDKCEEGLKSLMYAIMNPHPSGPGIELHLANKAFARPDFPFLESYINTLRDVYMADIEGADFAYNHDTERMKINDWVSSQTADMIKDLLPDGSLNSHTVMVLVNCIYFKGLWEYPFSPGDSFTSTFYKTESVTKDVSFMAQSNQHQFMDLPNHGCTVLIMRYRAPFENMCMSNTMSIILPKEIEGLKRVERDLEAILKLLDDGDNSRKVECHIQLPKFNMEESVPLKDTLISLGINDLFMRGVSDLSGVNGSDDIYVSDAIHKARIEVDEEGSTAAAATGCAYQSDSICFNIKYFKCDHPFIFVIRKEKQILFMGRVCDL